MPCVQCTGNGVLSKLSSATEYGWPILSLSLPRSVGCPISRSFFARYGIPQRSTCFFPKVEKKVKVRGIPHLAKNERDMGHPTLLGRDKDSMPTLRDCCEGWGIRRAEATSRLRN